MAAAEPTSSAQPTPQAQAQPPPPPPHGAPSSHQSAALAGGSSRHEKSLGLLTTKFVSLLQEAQDGVLDLKAVSGGRGWGWGGRGLRELGLTLTRRPRLGIRRYLGRGGAGVDAGAPTYRPPRGPGHKEALREPRNSRSALGSLRVGLLLETGVLMERSAGLRACFEELSCQFFRMKEGKRKLNPPPLK